MKMRKKNIDYYCTRRKKKVVGLCLTPSCTISLFTLTQKIQKGNESESDTHTNTSAKKGYQIFFEGLMRHSYVIFNLLPL